jgi:hypothetical protein
LQPYYNFHDEVSQVQSTKVQLPEASHHLENSESTTYWFPQCKVKLRVEKYLVEIGPHDPIHSHNHIDLGTFNICEIRLRYRLGPQTLYDDRVYRGP